MNVAKTFTGRHIEISVLGHQPIDYGETHLTIKPVTIDGQARVSVSVGNATARHIVILDPADMVDIAETCIGIFNTELEDHGFNKRLAIHNEQA